MRAGTPSSSGQVLFFFFLKWYQKFVSFFEEGEKAVGYRFNYASGYSNRNKSKCALVVCVITIFHTKDT